MTTDLNSVKQAMSRISDFPGQITAARNTAANVSLGPWKLDVRCDHGYLNTRERHFWWNVDFSGPRSSLQHSLQTAEAHANQFNASFAPVHDWHDQTIGQVSNAFEDAKDYMHDNRSGLMQENWNGPLHQELLVKLNKIIALIQISSDQFSKGMHSMLNFLDAQNSLNNNINSTINNLQAQANDVLRRMKIFVDEEPCGHDDAYSQYNSFKAQFEAAQNTFSASFTTLTQKTNAANNALNVLVGMIMNFLNDLKPVQQQLQAAEATDTYVFELLDLDVAAGEWAELADYAKSLDGEKDIIDEVLDELGDIASSFGF